MAAKTSVETPIYTDRRRPSSGSGGTGFLIFIVLLLLLATGGSGWLYFDQVNKNAQLRQEMIDIKQSMSIVREALQITDESITDQYQQRNKQLETLQEEVNKLWILTNKKQKSQIQLLMSRSESNLESVKKLSETDKIYQQNFDAAQSITQTTFTAIEEASATTQSRLEEIQTQLNELLTLDEITKQINENSKTLANLANSRTALNSRVAKLQQEISILKSKIITLENNQPIPSYNLDRTAPPNQRKQLEPPQ